MSRSSGRDFEDVERAMHQVRHRLEGNMHCADCSSPRPEYANLTLGTFICKDCADVHRNISNRRIKDILGRDLTMDDVRRMDTVGNDIANRKFLATWDPREFPEPKQGDKEGLKNFIWLKYDGSWKKPDPRRQHSSRQDSGRQDRYYGNGVDRDHNIYGRERDLFRDTDPPPPPQQQQQSFWADRVGQASARPPTHDDFRRSYSNDLHQDRFRRDPSYNRQDRFRPPPAQAYGRAPDRGSRYEEVYEEEYDRYDRVGRQREPSGSEQRLKERSGRKKASAKHYTSEDEESYDIEEGAQEKRKTNRRRGNESERKSKSSKSRRKKVVSDEEEETISDGSEESDEDYASRSKKMLKKKRVTKKSVRKRDGKKGSNKREVETNSDESEDDSEEDYSPPPTNLKNSRKSKAKTSTSVSVVTNPFEDDEAHSVTGNEVANSKPSAQAKVEFDLMSDWMGGETDATTGPNTSSTQTTAASQQPAQQPAGMQMPMITPPMSMYGGMMPPAAAAYMTGIPGTAMQLPPHLMGFPPMTAFQGHPGYQPMPGFQPMMYPGGVAVPPGAGVMPHMGGAGLVSSMQNMNLQPGMQQPSPPPPPPLGAANTGPAPPPPTGPPPK